MTKRANRSTAAAPGRGEPARGKRRATKADGDAARRSLRWEGRVDRFSSLMEGGPGRPKTLGILASTGFGLLAAGIMRLGVLGDAWPVMIVLGAFVLLTLVFWVLIKAGMRSRDVVFVIDRKGVHIKPSAAQRSLDRRLHWLMLMVFWLTLKGGQWAAWAPMTPWREVRSVRVERAAKQVLVRGGAWHIRLMCTAENFDEVVAALHARCTRDDVVWQT